MLLGLVRAQLCWLLVQHKLFIRAGALGEAAMKRMAAQLRINEPGGRHLFICSDQTVPKCCKKVGIAAPNQP
jgi:hypothetical protein